MMPRPTTNTPFLCPAAHLRLGDRVRIGSQDDPFNTAIVKKVTETEALLYRPYGHSEDFSYSGGVICYVGIEEITIPRNGNLWPVLQEGQPLR